MTNQTARVLYLLKKFNDGEKVCIKSLQNEYYWQDKSEKTIRRDLNIIKSIFPQSFELISGGEGCYKAVTKSTFENFINEKNLSLFVQVFSLLQQNDLFESFDIDENDKKIILSKIKETNKVYEFKTKPLENKKQDFQILKTLQNSIQFQKVILINYKEKGRIKQYEVKPYKIVFMNENLYLTCETNNDYMFSIFRVSHIEDIIQTSKTFHKNYDIESFIKDMQTPFAKYQPNYKQHLIDVKIEVDSIKAKYFKDKKFLKSQTIEKELENKNLIVNYKVTRELEVDDLIKRWIPFVRVIEPLSLKKRIENQLREYLSDGVFQ